MVADPLLKSEANRSSTGFSPPEPRFKFSAKTASWVPPFALYIATPVGAEPPPPPPACPCCAIVPRTAGIGIKSP